MTETTQAAPSRPQRFGKAARGAEVFDVTPLARLYRAHIFSAGGYAATVLALADSVFFSVDPSDARWRVMLGLLLTMAPFAFIAQFLGPLIEKVPGGNRFVLIAAFFGRGAIVVLMATQVETLLFFPLTFGFLVADRTYNIAKSAVVPGLIEDKGQLVKANSRLQIIGSIAGAALVPIAGLLVFLGPTLNTLRIPVSETLGGASWALMYAGLLFVVGGVMSLRIPNGSDADAKSEETDAIPEDEQTVFDPAVAHSRGGILLSSSAMAYVRAVSGFVLWLFAFEIRGGVDPGPEGPGVELGHRVRESLGEPRLDLAVGGAPTWHLGAIGAASVLGAATGSFLSPRLREQFSEDRNLAGMLGLISIVSLIGALIGGLVGAIAVAMAVGFGGSVGKQSFDAIVQRDTPQRRLGASFARFESRFQLVWVLGALIPVVLPIPARLGFLMVAGTAGFAAVSYWLGKDPAPKTEVARRTAAAASARATQTVREKARDKTRVSRTTRPGRRRRAGTDETMAEPFDGSAPPTAFGEDPTAIVPVVNVPTAEHPAVVDPYAVSPFADESIFEEPAATDAGTNSASGTGAVQRQLDETTQLQNHRPAMTDTQPVPIVSIDPDRTTEIADVNGEADDER